MNSKIQLSDTEKTAARLGFSFSLITAILTVLTFGMAITTPPLSGPFCPGGCFQYPYNDIVSRFPRDYFWMYPAILLSFTYLSTMTALYFFTPFGKKIFGLLGLLFAFFSAMVLSVNYFVQVSVVQPSLLAGETEGIALLTQFNPHGIFIVAEEIGFFVMGLSFFCFIPVFSRQTRLEKSLGRFFFAGFLAILIAFTAVSLKFGICREYRFEVAVITISWLQLIVSAFLLAVFFRRKLKV